MRETPVVSRHLHVPLQSGDDDVLRAMGRRYTIGQYRARIEPLDDFNLTTDVIVGFPTEDERAFAQHDGGSGGSRHHEGARLPVLAAAGNADRRRRSRARGTSRRSGARGCARRRTQRAGRAGRTGSGSRDVVLVDRPGLGYADDYTPWLVDAPIGAIVPAEAVGVADEGVLAVVAA